MEEKQISTAAENIWVIRAGKIVEDRFGTVTVGATSSITQYDVSELARYMLSPKPVQVTKKLVGCEVHYKPSWLDNMRNKLHRHLPEFLKTFAGTPHDPIELLMANYEENLPSLRNADLEAHFERVYGYLRHYDPIQERLTRLDQEQIVDIVGIHGGCFEKNSTLVIQGNTNDKASYVRENILRDVSVVINKAYLSNGLFEMKGFPFEEFNPESKWKLLRFNRGNESVACLLTPSSERRVEFWIEDTSLIHCMHMLQNALNANNRFRNTLIWCVEGKAKPLKMLFNKKLSIDYSEERLPESYQQMFDCCRISRKDRDRIIKYLKKHQFGISFNTVPQSDAGEEKLVTTICVLHNVNAMEPIRKYHPELYSEINKRVITSEAGSFYLLDSIKGFVNE